MQTKRNDIVPIEFEQLEEGYEFPSATYELTPETIASYLEAVGDITFLQTGSVPPMAIAAYAMSALSQVLSMPPGSIHTAQEMEFLKSVPLGTTVSCNARVVQKQARARFRLLVVEINISDQDEEVVLREKTTLILPE